MLDPPMDTTQHIALTHLPVASSFYCELRRAVGLTLSLILTGSEEPAGEHGRPESSGEPEDPEQGNLWLWLMSHIPQNHPLCDDGRLTFTTVHLISLSFILWCCCLRRWMLPVTALSDILAAFHLFLLQQRESHQSLHLCACACVCVCVLFSCVKFWAWIRLEEVKFSHIESQVRQSWCWLND